MCIREHHQEANETLRHLKEWTLSVYGLKSYWYSKQNFHINLQRDLCMQCILEWNILEKQEHNRENKEKSLSLEL